MTEVSLYRDEKETILTISGHAEYAQDGDDIVCSACSVLSGTIATMIDDMDIGADIVFKEGLTRICIENDRADYFNKMRIVCALDFVMMGFSMLEEEYPSNVIIIER